MWLESGVRRATRTAGSKDGRLLPAGSSSSTAKIVIRSLTYLLTQFKFSCSSRLPRTAPAPSATGRSCAAPPAPSATRWGQRSSTTTAGYWGMIVQMELIILTKILTILTIIYINLIVQPSLNPSLGVPPPPLHHQHHHHHLHHHCTTTTIQPPATSNRQQA